ncbi:MAG TPA: hypothetical protein VKR61_23625 [Bryobacteraceae bacterium]|nr:hypothetical protein [Bryobacteraceae bacterium]
MSFFHIELTLRRHQKQQSGPGELAGLTFDDGGNGISMDVRTKGGQTDVRFEASYVTDWQPDS